MKVVGKGRGTYLVVHPVQANSPRHHSRGQCRACFDPNLDATTLSRYVYIVRNVPVYGMDLQAVRERYIKKYGSMLLSQVCIHPAHLLCHFASVYSFMLSLYVVMVSDIAFLIKQDPQRVLCKDIKEFKQL